MPIYEVQGPDGRIYEVEGPEGASEQQIVGFLQQQLASQPAAPAQQGSWFGDVARSFGLGATGATGALTSVFGADNIASEKLGQAGEALQAGLSTERQAELQRQAERMQRAEESGSTWEEVKAGLLNVIEAPIQSAAQAVGSFAPMIATLPLAKLGLGAGAIMAVRGAIGGAQGAGAVKQNVYDAVLQAELDEGKPEEQAQAAAARAQSYVGDNLDQILLGAGLGTVAGSTGVERILPGGARAQAGALQQAIANRIGQRATSAGAAALGEMPLEGLQGGQERLAANLALQRTGRDVDTFTGVAGQATQEALMGGLGGATIGAALPDRSREIAAEAERQRLAAEEDARLERAEAGFLEAEREAPTAAFPSVRTQQAALPGFEELETTAETPAPAVDATELQADRVRFAQMLERNQEELSEANAAQDFDRTEQLMSQRDAIEQRLAETNETLQSMGVPDPNATMQLQQQLARVENQLAKQSGPGTDPAKVKRLVTQRRDLRSRLDVALEQQGVLGQQALDLGAPRELTDPAVEGERFGAQQAQQELQSRQQLMQEQRVSPEAQPDLFAESMEEVETQRREGETNFDYLDPIFEQAFDQDRPAVAPPEGITPSERSQSLMARLDALEQQITQAKNNEERQRLLDQRTQLASTADADPNLRIVYETRSQAEDALLNLESSIDDLRTGTFMGGENQGAASSTQQGLNRRAEEAKQTYIRGVLQEAAALRRIRGERGLTSDEALQAADRINTELDELINRSQAVREVEEVVTQPAQMRGTEIVSPAQTAMRDVRPLEQRPFGKYRAALGTILDSVDQTRRSLLAPVSQPRVEQPLLRTQFAETEAQRVAEERGETATTLGGELRRRTEFVRNKMARMGGIRPQARDVLNRAADLMDEGRVTRDLLDSVEQVVDTINRGQMPFARDLRAITDVMVAMQETPAGQRELFDAPADKKRREEEIGYIRATAENFEKAPMVRKARAAIDAALQPAKEREERRAVVAKALQEVRSRLADLENKILALSPMRPPARSADSFFILTRKFLKPLDTTQSAKLTPEAKAAREAAERIEKEYGEMRDKFDAQLKKVAKAFEEARAPLIDQKGVLEKQLDALNKQITALTSRLQDPKVKAYRDSLERRVSAAEMALDQQRIDLQNTVIAATERVRVAELAQLRLQKDESIKAARKAVADAQAALMADDTYTGILQQQQRLALFKEGEASSTVKRIRNRIKKMEDAVPEDVKKRIEKMRKELANAEEALDKLLVDANVEVDGAYVNQLVSLDDEVKFERAAFKRMQDKLDSLIAESRDSTITPEMKALSEAAAEQRARVARAEKAQREAQEAADKKRADFKERLARGLDLPGFSTADTPQRKTLRVRIEALEAALDTPSPELTALQQRLAEQEAQPVNKAQKQRVAYTKRRVALAEDKYAAQQEEMQDQLRELRAKLGSYDAITQQQRAEAKAAEQMARERTVNFDPLAVIGVKKPGRAIGPVTRAQSAAPAQLRTESPESRAGESRAPVDRRMGEARGKKERDVPVKTSEMQEANRLADLIRKQTPAQKRKAAEEAAAVERELQKARANYSEGDFDALESAVRDTVYDSRPTFDLRANTSEAVQDGRILDALKTLEKNGSTDFVKQLATRLGPLMMRTKVRVVDNLTNSAGIPVEGLYDPNTNTIFLDRNGLNEESFLHEATHAATLNALRADPASLTPEQQQAVADLRTLFEQAQADTAFKNEYAIKNLEEFVAELMSNQKVRDKLDSMKPARQPSLLQRVYDAIMRMIGVERPMQSQRAVDAAYALFAPSKPSTGAVVASIARGVFPSHKPVFGEAAPASFKNSLTRTTADVSFGDKLSSFMLGMRTKTADQWAAREALLKAGLKGGKLDEAAATQSRIYMRLNSEANRFAHQALLDAPLALVKDEKGFFGVGVDEKRPGYAKVLETLRSVVGEAELDNMEAVEGVFQRMLQIERAETDGVGYDKINTRKPPTAAEVRKFKADIASNPKLKKAFDEARTAYRNYNDGMLDFAKAAGVFTADEVATFKKGNYVPYYRLNEATGNVVLEVGNSSRTIGNIINQPQLKELVGGEKAFLGLSESVLQNTQMLTRMALQNLQGRDVGFMIQSLGLGKIIDGEGTANTIRFKIDGKPKWVKLETDLFPPDIPAEILLQGLHGVKAAVPTALQLAGIPTNLLRSTIVRMPLYIIRQMIRDPLHAWFTTGLKFTPVVSSIKELTKIRKGLSENEVKLMRSGAISSNVMTGDYNDAARTLRDLTAKGNPWNKTMAALDNAAMQADASTRAVLYDKYRQQGMSHFEAALGAAEVMNFQRRGTSSSLYMMSTLVPFFNAQIQGVDSIYRGFKGDTVFENQLKVRNSLVRRSAFMLGLTLAYTMAMQDDEAYKNATPQEKAMNWFLPVPGIDASVRVPIPFEIGILTKAIPELLFNAGFNDASSKDTLKGLRFALGMSVPSVIPTAVAPLVELSTNYSFFRDGPIETMRDKAVAPEMRYRETTTELAKRMGEVAGVSPLQIEHFVRGYTSTAGILAMSMFNPILRPFAPQERGEKVERRITETPFFGAAFQPDTGRGFIDSVYADVEDWQQAASTFKRLVEEGRVSDARAFADKNSREIALSSTGGSFRQLMGQIAEMRRAIEANPTMTAKEKRDRIEELKKYQIRLAGKIRELAKASE